jgi:hypothetical protein
MVKPCVASGCHSQHSSDNGIMFHAYVPITNFFHCTNYCRYQGNYTRLVQLPDYYVCP